MKKLRPTKLNLCLETLRSPSDLDVPRAAVAEHCTAITRVASGCTSA